MKNLFLLIFISTLFATRLLVPEEYPTIQEGIDAAATGDTVLVNQGIYYESLIINKTITLTSYAIFDDLSNWLGYDYDMLQYETTNNNIAGTIIDGNTELGEPGGFVFSDELFVNSCISIYSSTECIEPIIMGFTIQNGEGDLYTPSDGSEPIAKGGAFFIHDAIPKINYNYIRDNGTVDFHGFGYSTFAGGAANVEPEDWGFDNTLLTSSREECEISFLDFTHNIYRDNQSTVGGVFSNTIGATVDISGSIVPMYDCSTEEILISSQYYLGGELIAENIEADLCAVVIADIFIDPNIDEECMNDADCGMEDNPFKTITKALTQIYPSQYNPITLHLAEGVYSPSDNGETFPIVLIDNIHLQGVDQGNTIIDAEQTDRVFKSYGINNTIISDLSIKGGYTYYEGGGINLSYSDITLMNITISENNAGVWEGGYGGGIFLYNSSPTLIDLTINDNSANHGGGLSLDNSNANLTNVIINGNSADYGGGGIYLFESSPTLTDVIISEENSANTGAGMYLSHSNPILIDVTINGNNAVWEGGGITLYYSNPTLIDVIISENNTHIDGDHDWGGGMYLVFSNPTLTGVIITGNSADCAGGMLIDNSNPILTDVIISGNSAVVRGGIWINNSNPTFNNITITGNSAEQVGGGVSIDSDSNPTFINSIIWNNIPESIFITEESYEFVITYSNIEGGWEEGEGNIDSDPLFTDPENGDYTLQEGSPCIDTGMADLDGDGVDDITDYYGSAPDMGAFEYNPDDDLDNNDIIPTIYNLSPAYPNPFNPVTTIDFSVPYYDKVSISIYDINGRLVTKLSNRYYNPGNHSISWNASSYASGVYFIKMKASDFLETQKVMLLK